LWVTDDNNQQWKPIETAPRNGKDILIGGDYSYRTTVLVASWRVIGWVDMEGDLYNPTHWMPLPEAPLTTT
jgi:hypothetical protein